MADKIYDALEEHFIKKFQQIIDEQREEIQRLSWEIDELEQKNSFFMKVAAGAFLLALILGIILIATWKH